jgi:hypothetical protein
LLQETLEIVSDVAESCEDRVSGSQHRQKDPKCVKGGSAAFKRQVRRNGIFTRMEASDLYVGDLRVRSRMGRTVTEGSRDVIFLGTIRSDLARTISEPPSLVNHQQRQRNRQVRSQIAQIGSKTVQKCYGRLGAERLPVCKPHGRRTCFNYLSGFHMNVCVSSRTYWTICSCHMVLLTCIHSERSKSSHVQRVSKRDTSSSEHI